eukprot:13892766-Alexandrium_andersonii.AAC.1
MPLVTLVGTPHRLHSSQQMPGATRSKALEWPQLVAQYTWSDASAWGRRPPAMWADSRKSKMGSMTFSTV